MGATVNALSLAHVYYHSGLLHGTKDSVFFFCSTGIIFDLQAAPCGLAASATANAILIVVVVAAAVGLPPERPVVRGLEEHGDDRLHLEHLRRLLHD